jgi:hypothetical protein
MAGNVTEILTEAKFSSRIAKTITSFFNGGFSNPALYLNGSCVILSGTSLGLKYSSKMF